MNNCLLQPNSTLNETLMLKTARSIGDHLLKTAFWDQNHTFCNWIGRRDIEDKEIAPYAVRTAALSPELYSGSAGIALFLIELYRLTGDTRYEKAAIGAWLRSVEYMKTNEFPATPISFYAGQLGLIYVGYKCLEYSIAYTDRITDGLKWLIPNLEAGLNVKHSLDVVGGNAGAIAPLLYIARKYNVELCRKVALSCAQEIVDLGIWKDDICYWQPQKVHGVELELPPLTGYSHGASGLAVGLLEAYRETEDSTFLKYARGAFAFEEALFCEEEGNWIDTRYPQYKRNGKIGGTCRAAWCHGAPGIALAHMRASSIDVNRHEYHESRAQIAIDTTKKKLAEKLESPAKDATLCHGVLGLTDVMLTYGKYVNNPDLIDLAKAETIKYIDLFPNPVTMPSGLSAGGYSPCLMVGLAGVGLHCLRIIDHSIASALIIIP